MLRQGLPLEAALARATEGLDRADDRAFAHAIAAETLRRLPDLDKLIDSATAKPLPFDAKARFVLRIALIQALTLGTPGHAAIATVLPLVDGGPRRLVHGVYGTIMRRGGVALPDPPTLPPPVAKRWRRSWGKEVAEAARPMLATPPPLDVTLRDPAATETWAEQLAGSSLMPGHVRLPRGTAVAELPGYAAGEWWVQDISASLPARLIGPGQGSALDLCAAPGGKTLQLAAAGWGVTSVDASESRLVRLGENLARTGFSAETVAADVMAYEPPAPFEVVLLDAPCSATGIFRRHPDVLHRVRDRAIAALAETQAAMLARAAEWVKPGGILVYSVCSLEPEEGEHVADAFAADRRFARDPIVADELPAGLAPTGAGRVRVLPGMLTDVGGADGFFVARFRRVG